METQVNQDHVEIRLVFNYEVTVLREFCIDAKYLFMAVNFFNLEPAMFKSIYGDTNVYIFLFRKR